MKIQKSFITVLCIVLLTALTLCPVQSEAASYGSIVVTASGFTVDGGPSQPLVNLPTYLVNTNTIGILTFGTGIVFPAPPLSVGADITNILIVDAGTEITLAGTASTTGANVTVDGTLNGNVATGAGFVKVNSGGIINGKVGDASMTGNVTVYDGASINSAGGTPSIMTKGSVNLPGGDVSNREIVDASSVTTSTGTKVQSTGPYAIDKTTGNVKVNDSTISAKDIAIKATGGNVTVTDSTVSAGNYGISGTSGDVTVTGATSEISGGQGGIKDTGGSVEIGKNVKVDGGTGAAISNTAGTVAVGSLTGGAIITGAQGIINTGGDLIVTESGITGTNGDAINGVSGDVDISKSTITSHGGSGIVLEGSKKITIEDTEVAADWTGIYIKDNSVAGNKINNPDITAGVNGLTVINTKDLTVNLDKAGSITAGNAGIIASGADTELKINSTNGNSLGVTSGVYGMQVNSGATLNDNVKTNITTSEENSAGVYVSGPNSNANFKEALTIDASGVGSHGILLTDGGTLNASKEVVIKSGSPDSTGILAQGLGSTATIDGNTVIEMTGDNSWGIYAVDGGTVNLNNGLELDATGAGEMRGLFAKDDGNIYVNGGNINVATSGVSAGDAYGAEATGNSNITFENFGDITVRADAGNAYGLFANDPSTISGDVASITVTASGNAYGAVASDDSIIDASVGTIAVTSLSAGEAIGIGAVNSGDVKVDGLTDLTVTSDGRAVGIGAEDDSKASVSMENGDITVKATSDNAYGITAQLDSYVGLTGAKDMVVSADQGDAYGLYAGKTSTIRADVESIQVTATDSAYGAVAQEPVGEIDLLMDGDMTVKSTGTGEVVGIGAQDDSSHVKVEGLGKLTVNSTDGRAIGIGADNYSYATVAMSGDIELETLVGKAHGVAASNTSNVILTEAQDMRVSTADGKAFGVNAYNGSTVSAEVKSITVKATDAAYGAVAELHSTVDLHMDGAMDVASNGIGEAIGIGAVDSGDVKVDGLTDLRVEAKDGRAIGIGAASAGLGKSKADVSMAGDITVGTAIGDAYGATAELDSRVDLTGAKAMVVSADAGNAAGLFAWVSGIISADVESITVTANEAAYGAYATNSSEMDILMSDDMTVHSTGTGNAWGIGAEISSDVTIAGLKNLTVEAANGDATGIKALEDGSKVDVTMDGNITVGTAIGDAYGATAELDSRVDLTGAKAMVVSADAGKAYGLYAFESGIINAEVVSVDVTASGKAYGALANKGSSIDLTMDGGTMQVRSTTAGNASGIAANEGSDVIVKGLTGLEVTSEKGQSTGIFAQLNNSKASVAMSGDIQVKSNTEGMATGIAAFTSGDVKVDGLTDLKVTAADGHAVGITALADVGDYSKADVAMSGTIAVESTTKGTAWGIDASVGDVKVKGLKGLTVKAKDGHAYGIDAVQGSTVDVSMDGDITVETASGDAYGVKAVIDGTHVSLTGARDMVVSADAGKAFGLYAANTSEVGAAAISADVESIKVTASSNAYGIGTDYFGKIDADLDGNVTVMSTTSGEAYGIKARYYGNVVVTGLEDLLVTTVSGDAYGIGGDISGDVKVDGLTGLTAKAADGDAAGIFSMDNSKVKITMDSDKINNDILVHSVTGGNAYGAHATGDSNITFANVRNMVVSADAGDAFGLFANDPSTIIGDVESITVTALNNAYGAFAWDDGIINTVMDGDITVRSTGTGKAIGIGAVNSSDVTITGLKDLTVTTADGYARGIAAADDSKVNVTMAGDIVVNAIGGDAYGVNAFNDSEVKLKGGNIDVTGTQKVRGLDATLNSNITMTNGNIVVSGDADKTAFMEVNKHGAIHLNNVTANVDTAKENALDETRTLITTDSSGVVSADLGTVIAGNIIHTGANDGSLDIYITGGSKIIGAANVKTNDDARINITLDSLPDTWEVTADSYTNGTLTNGGIVDYQQEESLLAYNNDPTIGDFKTVDVDHFIGNGAGKVKMKADINGAANDLLVAQDSGTGANTLVIQNLTNSGVARSGALVKVYKDATLLDLNGTDEDGNSVIDAGAWNYVLTSGDIVSGKEWYLARNTLTSTGQGIVSSMVNADVWYREVDTLLNRMGIYRDGNYYGGVWFEAAANKHEIDGGFGSQYDQQFTNFTLGWDKMYAKENGDLFLGIMGGYGKADRDIGNIGTTDFESMHAALYGIYRTHDGFYATGLVKYNNYDNDMSLFGVDKFSQKLLAELGEGRVRGDWDQDGYGVSLQIGKRMDRDNGWYLEPQAQLSYMRINGDNYRTNTGIQVGIDDADSFRGRVGLLVGRSIQLKDETKLDVFGSLSLVHEFDGETDITMDDGKWTSDLGGTWGVFGAGFNWNFQPGKYVHGGVSYATGDNRDEPWGVYLGLSIELGGGKSAREKVETALKEAEAKAAEAEAETEVETEAEVEPAA